MSFLKSILFRSKAQEDKALDLSNKREEFSETRTKVIGLL